jgi:predicted porin
MQKKLLALAIAGAMAAPLAAQAQGSNVTIYGLLQPSLDFIDDSSNSGTSMQTNNSRIGFRGSEDLGNGLKAIFQLESQIDFDERGDQGIDVGDELADGSWVRRDSWLGLSGGFGSVTFGNHQSAYVRVSASYDPFGDSIGDYNNILAAFGAGGDEFNSRFRNSVYYTSPNWSGFQLLASYALSGDGDDDGFEDDSGDGDNDTFSIGLSYAWGPFGFFAAYEDQGNSTDSGGTDFEDVDAWKIGASYKFGGTTLYAIYVDEDFGLRETDFGDFSLERSAWYVAVSHTMGKLTFAASYTDADDFDDLDDSGAKAFALGVTYGFSKRTSISAYYAKVDNDDNAAYGMDSGYAAVDDAGDPVQGESVDGFSVRLRHSF